MQEQSKRPSGWQRRKLRVEQGLPRYTPGEAIGRKKHYVRRAMDRSRRNEKLITELKLRLGCTDCGFNAHSAALDFDHLPGFEKRATVSSMLARPTKTLMAEVAKCEVVCSNCHRIRTWKRNRESTECSP